MYVRNSVHKYIQDIHVCANMCHCFVLHDSVIATSGDINYNLAVAMATSLFGLNIHICKHTHMLTNTVISMCVCVVFHFECIVVKMLLLLAMLAVL